MMFEKVRSMLAKQLELPEDDITMDTDIIHDLGADSLDVVELIMMLEDEYGLYVTEDEAKELYTVRRVVDFLDANVM